MGGSLIKTEKGTKTAPGSLRRKRARSESKAAPSGHGFLIETIKKPFPRGKLTIRTKRKESAVH